MGLEQKYYAILGIPASATISDVKKAYRYKAKKLHPDLNPSPNAEAEFIELQEAYEYIEALHKNGSRIKKDPQINEFEKWWRAAAQEAQRKEKQKRNAKMRYEEYINSEEYKLSAAINNVGNLLRLLFTIAVFIIIPPFMFIYNSWLGLFASIFIMAATIPVTWPIITELKSLRKNLSGLKNSFATIRNHDWFYSISNTPKVQFIIFLPINLFLLFKIAFNTLIPLSTQFIIYSSAMLLGVIVTYAVKKINKKYLTFFSLCLAPFIVNIFFLINFTISFNPKTESYSYFQTTHFSRTGNRYESSSFIYLENKTYEKYNGLRLFSQLNDLDENNRITFTFKDGLFGLRVMKNYTLENSIIEDDY